MEESMLTTFDNPFDPFTDYDAWFNYDLQSGYHTPSYLARIVRSSDSISEQDQELAIEQAIDEIIRENPFGIHRKVTRTVAER